MALIPSLPRPSLLPLLVSLSAKLRKMRVPLRDDFAVGRREATEPTWDVHNSTRQRRPTPPAKAESGRNCGRRRARAPRRAAHGSFGREGNLNGMQIKATDRGVAELD